MMSMKYVDFGDGMRVGVGKYSVSLYAKRDDGFGSEYYHKVHCASTVAPDENPMFRDSIAEAILAQVIAALVEKLGEQNEPA